MDNLEEKFRKGFSDFESPVTADQWDRLKGDAARIAKRNRDRNRGAWLFIPLMFVGLVWLSYGMFSPKDQTNQIAQMQNAKVVDSASVMEAAGSTQIQIKTEEATGLITDVLRKSELAEFIPNAKKYVTNSNVEIVPVDNTNEPKQEILVSSQSFLSESLKNEEENFGVLTASTETVSRVVTLSTGFLNLKGFDLEEYKSVFPAANRKKSDKGKKSDIYFRKKVPGLWIGLGNSMNSTFANITPSNLDQKLITNIKTPSKFDSRRSSMNWSLQFEKKINDQFGWVGSLGYNRQSYALSYDVFEEIDRTISIVRNPADNTLTVSQNVLDASREIELASTYLSLQVGGRYYLSKDTPRIFFDGRVGANYVQANDFSDIMLTSISVQQNFGDVNKDFFVSAGLSTGIQLNMGPKLRFTFGPGLTYQFTERSFYNKEISLRPYDINFNTSLVYKLR